MAVVLKILFQKHDVLISRSYLEPVICTQVCETKRIERVAVELYVVEL